MAAGGEGYFHASYWHDEYWHDDYWFATSSPPSTVTALGGFNPAIYDMLEHIPIVIFLLWVFL